MTEKVETCCKCSNEGKDCNCKITLKKVFYLRCGHKLTGLPKGHKCKNLHGEYYTVTLILEAPFKKVKESEACMLIDFADIKKIFKEKVFEQLDHAFLVSRDDEDIDIFNELKRRGYKIVILPKPPTAEFLAKYIYKQLKDDLPYLIGVSVIESADNEAIFVKKD